MPFDIPKRVPALVRRAHKTRIAYLQLDKGVLRVEGHCLLLSQVDGEVEIPGSLLSCLMLEPGVSVTHEAVKLCAENSVLILWVGEGMTRLYGCAFGHQRPERIVSQALTTTDNNLRLKAAARLYELMFDDPMPPSYSIEKLRGIEGSRVKQIYQKMAEQHGFTWSGRNEKSSLNEAIGYATSCLYALCEVAILASGFHPSIGVVHTGNGRSMVFDLADTVKFKTVVPLAFSIAKDDPPQLNMKIRHACRDYFAKENLFEQLLANLGSIFEVET